MITQRIQTVIMNKTTGKVLIIRRKNPQSKILQWRLIKGGVEKGETRIHALKREIKEEIGLKKFGVSRIIHSYSYQDQIGHVNRVTTFLVYAPMGQKKKLNEEEGIKKAKWVKPERAISILYFDDERKAVTKVL